MTEKLKEDEMNTENKLYINLEQVQKDGLIRLMTYLDDCLDKFSKLEASSTPMTAVEYSTVFGILGSRGSGKSMMLRSLYNEFQPINSTRSELNKNCKKEYILLEPIDCSATRSGIEANRTILLRLLQFLENYHDADLKEKLKRPIEDLGRVINDYARTSTQCLMLNAELSNSINEFTNYVTENEKKLLSAPTRLTAVLETILNVLRKDAHLILLDDLDLVPDGNEIRHWLHTLMVDLHQHRMLILLTADLYRLEHLNWGEQVQFDEKTGRALINKILPVTNRIVLKEWPDNALDNFPTWAQDNRRLPDLLNELPSNLSRYKSLIRQLVPRYPRGVHDFYTQLRRMKDDKEGRLEPTKKDLTFLGILATCRQESLLSREINEKREFDWAYNLKFSKTPCEAVAWSEMVEAAAQRKPKSPKDNEESDSNPICGLPLNPLSHLTPLVPAKDASLADPEGVVYVVRAPTTHAYRAMETGSGLRQDELRNHPLKDAHEKDYPFWSELLINLGLETPNNTDKPAAMRNRIHLFNTWQPIVERVTRACFHIEVSDSSFLDFLEDDLFGTDRIGLYWVDIQRGGDAASLPSASHNLQVKIGWPALFDALRGGQNFYLPQRLLKLANLAYLKGKSSLDRNTMQEMLPCEIWAIVLFTEGLRRCPWDSFSRPQRWLLFTFVGLAAAFVRTAYVYALTRAGILDQSSLGAQQTALLNMLEAQDPSYLIQRGQSGFFSINEESDIHAILAALFDEKEFMLELDKQDDALSKAACAFLDSSVYKTVATQITEIHETTLQLVGLDA